MNILKRFGALAALALLAILGVGGYYLLSGRNISTLNPVSVRGKDSKPSIEDMRKYCPDLVNTYTEQFGSSYKVANTDVQIEKVDGMITKQGDPDTDEGAQYDLHVEFKTNVSGKEVSNPAIFQFRRTERGWAHSSFEINCLIPR